MTTKPKCWDDGSCPTPIRCYLHGCREHPSFTCPRCGAVSYHPKDIENGYCGRCHDFMGPGAK